VELTQVEWSCWGFFFLEWDSTTFHEEYFLAFVLPMIWIGTSHPNQVHIIFLLLFLETHNVSLVPGPSPHYDSPQGYNQTLPKFPLREIFVVTNPTTNWFLCWTEQGARLACGSGWGWGHPGLIPEVRPWATILPPMKEGVIRPYFEEMKIFVFKYIFRHLPSYIEVPLQEKGKSMIVKTVVEKAKTIIDSVGVFYHRLVRSRSCSSSQ
jgi:hypothetical protein